MKSFSIAPLIRDDDAPQAPPRRSSLEHILYSRNRRAELRARGLCINGARHGPATHGSKCEACRLVHRIGAEDARSLPEYKAANAARMRRYRAKKKSTR